MVTALGLCEVALSPWITPAGVLSEHGFMHALTEVQSASKH